MTFFGVPADCCHIMAAKVQQQKQQQQKKKKEKENPNF